MGDPPNVNMSSGNACPMRDDGETPAAGRVGLPGSVKGSAAAAPANPINSTDLDRGFRVSPKSKP